MTVSIVTTNELQTENDQGFVAVTSSRIKNNNYNRRSYKQDGNNNKKGKGRYIPPPQKTLAELLQQKIDLLRDSPFMKACIDILRDNIAVASRRKCRKCLCFGLGSFRHSPKSLLQLALLQILLESDFLEIGIKPISMDPEFSAEDTALLESLGHEVLDYREDILDLHEDTFLYMPHCPRWLYEQLLDKNNDNKDRMLLLSNDLSLYAEREIRAEELKKIPRLRALGKTFQTSTLPEYEERPDAFNDMAWQWVKGTMNSQAVTAGKLAQVTALTSSVASLSLLSTEA